VRYGDLIWNPYVEGQATLQFYLSIQQLDSLRGRQPKAFKNLLKFVFVTTMQGSGGAVKGRRARGSAAAAAPPKTCYRRIQLQ
jgi:hypothetical protein